MYAQFSVLKPITLEPVGISLPNLSTWCAARQGWKFGYKFFWACTRILCGRTNRHDFGQSHRSPERIEISTSRKRRYQPQSLPGTTKKFGELWFTNNEVSPSNENEHLGTHFSGPAPFLFTHKNQLFWKTIFRPLVSAASDRLVWYCESITRLNFYMWSRMAKACKCT